MEERILEFIGDLRRAEMRISPSEALDALAASTEIGLEDRETFKSALATTLHPSIHAASIARRAKPARAIPRRIDIRETGVMR